LYILFPTISKINTNLIQNHLDKITCVPLDYLLVGPFIENTTFFFKKKKIENTTLLKLLRENYAPYVFSFLLKKNPMVMTY